MKIELATLDGPLPFDERVAVEPARLDNELVTAPIEVRLVGEVRPNGEFFSISGHSSATGALACCRCLEDVRWDDDDDFTVRYRLSPVAEAVSDEVALDPGDLEVVVLADAVLDLAELAAEQVLLALPMRPLCSEGCAGLCPQCGANRNRDGACQCEAETDPRWRDLADLVDAGNGS